MRENVVSKASSLADSEADNFMRRKN